MDINDFLPNEAKIVGVSASCGDIVDSITLYYDSAPTARLGGGGGADRARTNLAANEYIKTVRYTKVRYGSYDCIGKVVFTTNLGKEFSYSGNKSGSETVTLSDPGGKLIANLSGTIAGGFLSKLSISKTK